MKSYCVGGQIGANEWRYWLVRWMGDLDCAAAKRDVVRERIESLWSDWHLHSAGSGVAVCPLKLAAETAALTGGIRSHRN